MLRLWLGAALVLLLGSCGGSPAAATGAGPTARPSGAAVARQPKYEEFCLQVDASRKVVVGLSTPEWGRGGSGGADASVAPKGTMCASGSSLVDVTWGICTTPGLTGPQGGPLTAITGAYQPMGDAAGVGYCAVTSGSGGQTPPSLVSQGAICVDRNPAGTAVSDLVAADLSSSGVATCAAGTSLVLTHRSSS